MLGALVAALGCREGAAVRPRPSPPAATVAASAASAAQAAPPATAIAGAAEEALPPLGGEWLVRLPVDGFGPAAVSVPLGATSPRPIVVALHGRNDRPEWACGEWRGVTDAAPFVLCPHGTPVDAPPGQGLAFADAERTRREIDAGLDALRARFGPHVAGGPMIFAGFSLGAILGARIVTLDPARFPIAVLGEGGQEQWTRERAATFARGGGRRVLFVCSTEICETEVFAPLATLARVGVPATMVSAGRIGHLVDDRVVAAVREAWPWVTGQRPGAAAR